MDGSFDVWAFFFANLFVAFVVWLVVFGICALVAAFVAPPRRKWRWGLLTLFFLGPIGVGFAGIAPPLVADASGAWFYECDRCGAPQNVLHGTKSADCWRCGDTLF